MIDHHTRPTRGRISLRTQPDLRSSLGFIVGALTFITHVVMRSVLTAGVDPVDSAQAPLWVPVNMLGVIGALLVLMGLPTIYHKVTGQAGMRSRVGFLLIAVSWIFFGVFLSLYGALVLPWLASEAPALISGSASIPVAFMLAYGLAALAWLAGSVLVSIPFASGQQRPGWIGYILPGSAIWFLVGSFVIAPDGPASNLALNLLSNLGPVLLLIAFGYPAWSNWTSRPPADGTGRT